MDKTKTVRLEIKNYEDRASIVSILAFAGYKVWIEEEDIYQSTSLYKNYYVCFEMEADDD